MAQLAIDYHGSGAFKPRAYEPAAPAAGEVQIAVAFTGICGTDLTISHGGMDGRVKSPWPIGHEMSGTIAELGEGVDGWAVGDKVTVMPLDWCGECPACMAGNNHICHNLTFVGIDSPGSLQDRWNVKARWLVRLPVDLDLRTAALVEPVAVAVHDVNRADVQAGDKVAVIGGGPIGLLIAVIARSRGAEVLLSEVAASRLKLAARAGLRDGQPRQAGPQRGHRRVDRRCRCRHRLRGVRLGARRQGHDRRAASPRTGCDRGHPAGGTAGRRVRDLLEGAERRSVPASTSGPISRRPCASWPRARSPPTR